MPEYTNINWILIRYSDVLLMYAETENWLNDGPTSDAVDAFKQVRKRAFSGNETLVDNINYLAMSKDEFHEALMNERWWEFGAEAIRKYDLIRWNKLAERLDSVKRWQIHAGDPNLATLDPDLNARFPIYAYYKTTTDISVSDPIVIYSNVNNDPLYPTADGWIKTNARSTGTTGSSSMYGGDMQYFARDFEVNKKELMPIPQSVCDDNPMLSQHPSY